MSLKDFDSFIHGQQISTRLHMGYWDDVPLVVTPSIGKKLGDKIVRIVSDEINNKVSFNCEDYNVVGANDGTIEFAKSTNFKPQIDIIVNAIGQPTQPPSSDDFGFFIYEFHNLVTDESLYAFRRTKKLKSLKRGFVGSVISGKFEDLDDDGILGVDDYVDFLIFNAEIYIFQHISFERILKLKDQFLSFAKNVLSNKKLAQKIDGFDNLKNAALNNSNYVKRLSKLDGTNRSTLFLDDLKKTEQVSNQFNLGITVKPNDDKIFYTDESQLGNFINLMQDAYYLTLIGQEKGIDETR